MGLLSKILETENCTDFFLPQVIPPVNPSSPEKEKKEPFFQNPENAKNSNPKFSVVWATCPKCESPLLWMDAYKTIHCYYCDPPKFHSAVRKISLALGEAVADIEFIFGNHQSGTEFSQTLALRTPQFEKLSKPCRCGSKTGVDIKISGNRIRRDCAKCGRFVDFPKWHKK